MRFAIALTFFLVSTAPGFAGPAAQSALDALLVRASQVSGAPYRYHIVSLSHETQHGRTFEVTTESDGPRYRVRRCSRGVCSGHYFDGERGFDTTLNDTPLPHADRADLLQATLGAIVSYAFTAPAFRRGGGEVVERSPMLRDGKRYRRIAVAVPQGPFLDALVDPQSALVAAIVSDDGNLAFELADVRRIDGLALPFSIVRNGAQTQRFERRWVVQGRLEKPAGIVPAIAAGAAPLAMLELGRATDQPVVPCSLGGRRVACLFDSGNSGLAMSLELAEALGLEPRSGALEIAGMGRYVTGIVTAPPLTAGPATYPAADYAVLHDLHQYGYDVILGADAFAMARVTLDYPKREVRFAAGRAGAGDGAAGDGVPFTFENFIPILTLQLGDVSAPLAIDTGDESSINLAADFFAEHRTIFKPIGSRPVAGIGGASDEVTGVLPVLRLGKYDVARPGIAATKGLQPTARGHIGSGLLQHFAVTLDYARNRLEIVPRANDAAVSLAASPEPSQPSKR